MSILDFGQPKVNIDKQKNIIEIILPELKELKTMEYELQLKINNKEIPQHKDAKNIIFSITLSDHILNSKQVLSFIFKTKTRDVFCESINFGGLFEDLLNETAEFSNVRFGIS
jgi:hypothetical protein